MQPLVSILIPAYNAEPWIADTIASALAQAWPRKEIVIVDDGSSDQTLAIARGASSASVAVVTQPNQGAAAARNRALSISQGEYIQWLDADDLLAPDKISVQMQSVADGSHRTLLSSAWGCFIHRPRHAKFTPTVLWQDLAPLEWLLLKMERDAFMQTGTWLVSRELTEAAGPWDVRLLGDDDGEYFSRVILASDGVKFSREARAYYRTRVGGLGYVGSSSRKLEGNFLSVQLQIGYVRALEDSQRVRAACVTYLQRDLRWYHPDRPDLIARSHELATSLGGRLTPPKAPRKYTWIERAFGLAVANRTQLHYNRWKFSVVSALDKMRWRAGGGVAG